MPAQERLNAAYFQGSVLFAAMFGWACSSWVMFVAALVVLLAGNLVAGEIRPSKRSR